MKAFNVTEAELRAMAMRLQWKVQKMKIAVALMLLACSVTGYAAWSSHRFHRVTIDEIRAERTVIDVQIAIARGFRWLDYARWCVDVPGETEWIVCAHSVTP